jgi:signal transduction histidine kinase
MERVVLLNVSRIEAGRLTINSKPVDLAQLAQEVMTDVLPGVQNQQIDIVLEKPSSPLGTVLADADKTKEVFINLIGNSLKFTPSGGKITISFEQKDDMIITSVTDTGKGIKAEDMPKLFHKFGMIEGNYTRTTGQGTGLGLYISKSIIELQGGKMTVFSEGENKGTTFSFSLRKVQDSTTQQEK